MVASCLLLPWAGYNMKKYFALWRTTEELAYVYSLYLCPWKMHKEKESVLWKNSFPKWMVWTKKWHMSQGTKFSSPTTNGPSAWFQETHISLVFGKKAILSLVGIDCIFLRSLPSVFLPSFPWWKQNSCYNTSQYLRVSKVSQSRCCSSCLHPHAMGLGHSSWSLLVWILPMHPTLSFSKWCPGSLIYCSIPIVGFWKKRVVTQRQESIWKTKHAGLGWSSCLEIEDQLLSKSWRMEVNITRCNWPW